MNFPDFLRSIWTDPRFQLLDPPTRCLLFAAVSQVDQVGWWAPNPRLVQAEIPGIDLADAARQLDPWVQVHPTGWWSIKGYIAVQIGEDGLKLSSGFHRGCQRRLLVHQAREVKAGARPDSIEGLGLASPSGVDPSTVSNFRAAVPQGSPPRGDESPEPKAPSPKSEGPALPGGPGGGAPLSTPAEDAKGLEDVCNVLKQLGIGTSDRPIWALQALQRASDGYGWPDVLRAAGKYVVDPVEGGHSFPGFCRDLDRLVRKACTHPNNKIDRTYFTLHHDKFPMGLRSKRWRCNRPGCRHSEAVENSQWIPDHDHQYVLQDSEGFVLSDTGDVVKVSSWELCSQCGHNRAVQGQAVAP